MGQRDVHALGVVELSDDYRFNKNKVMVYARHGYIAIYKVRPPKKNTLIQYFTSMTPPSKKATARHISSRFYVYTSSVTQCIFIAHILLTLSTAQIQVIPKIMGWLSSGVIGFHSSSLVLRRSGGRTYHIPNYATRFVSAVYFHPVHSQNQALVTQTRDRASFQ